MNDILTSVRRTPYQSLASFLILFFTLFLSLFFFNLTSFFYGILSYVETRPQVTVYFQTQTKEKDILAMKQTASSSGKTESVNYISKNEALKIYRELNKDNPILLEMVSSDILPASLEIYAKKPEFLPEIAEYFKKQPGVDEVIFQKDIVDKLLKLTNALRKISAFVFIFLITISFIVLMTTTAFKIALKKDEIELLKLIGASDWYIKKPFLLEGMLFGAAAGTSAFLLYYLVYFYLKIFLSSYLAGIPNVPFYGLEDYNLYVWPPSLYFIAFSYFITVLFGVLIGYIGNFIATSKYIK